MSQKSEDDQVVMIKMLTKAKLKSMVLSNALQN